MVDCTRKQLLGYLLGALEESERESVENELDGDPKLLRDLASVRESLEPLWVVQPDYDPPPGLAKRTCEFVASYSAPWTNPSPDDAKRAAWRIPLAAQSMASAPAEGQVSHSGFWDFSVAVGIIVALMLLVFPAIQNSRFNSRLFTCQDHLRQIGLALTQYGETQHDYFPPVYNQGRLAGAGIYAPVLLSHGFVDRPSWFVCPDSPLAEDRHFRIPTLDEMLAASGEELARWRRSMGGSFGYSLGFVHNGRYYSPRNLRRPYFGIMADAPSTRLRGHQSVNHGGRGQNVLREDGGVTFYPRSKPHERADDVFVNEWGLVDAGKHRNDSVIGPSDSVPILAGGANCGTDL